MAPILLAISIGLVACGVIVGHRASSAGESRLAAVLCLAGAAAALAGSCVELWGYL